MERAMSRLLDDLWLSPFGETQPWAGDYLPLVNVREGDSEMVVSAELPGMKEEEIEVTVHRDRVRIAGEKREQAETREEDFYRMESSYGRFDRTIDLPAEVDEDKAEAEFKNGILTVRMQKSEESKTRTRRIPIKAG
jgi:HSP20 family protein